MLRRLVSRSLAAGALLALPDTLAAQVPVAARDLPRGHVLVQGDIAPAGSPDSAAAALVQPGWVTRRVVREGEPLRPPAVVPPPLVTRGDTVTVHWRIGAVQVARAGVALGDAMRGDTLLVRVGSLHRVRAVATGPSTVIVP